MCNSFSKTKNHNDKLWFFYGFKKMYSDKLHNNNGRKNNVKKSIFKKNIYFCVKYKCKWQRI